ncbi:hypothetical protein Tco_0105058 [Tanacetum coccineum]
MLWPDSGYSISFGFIQKDNRGGQDLLTSDLGSVTIPTTSPDNHTSDYSNRNSDDTPVIPTETPIIAPTIPPSPDYTPASPDYSCAYYSESDPFKDP